MNTTSTQFALTARKLTLAVMTFALLLGLTACDIGSSGPVQPQSDQPADPAQTGSFSLVGQDQVVSITEGSNGISLPVSILRLGDFQSTVRLSLVAAHAADSENLSFSFADATLESGESRTTLTLRLDIGVAPIRPQIRRLQVIATDGTQTLERVISLTVEPIDRPDIYLLIGQSNMEGFSNSGEKSAEPGGLDQPSARILQLNVTGNNFENFGTGLNFLNFNTNFASPRLIPAEDPLHDPFDPSTSAKTGTRIGPGLSFAKAALQNTTKNIVLVPAAWAGTAFCANSLGNLAWNPVISANQNLGGTKLYDRAVLRTNAAIQETGGILRGILWHQGESDATKAACAGLYEDNLKFLVQSLRTNIVVDARGQNARGPEAPIPFVLGTMSRGGVYAEYDEFRTIIDNVHRSVDTLIPFSSVSNHDDLVPPDYPCGQDSCIHFGGSAYREMGQRYYQSLQEILAR